MSTLLEPQLPLIQRGKVRDIYAVDEQYLLIVATDRLSAFDVVLPTPIPNKGVVLTQLSQFWFQLSQRLVANHLSTVPIETVLPPATATAIADRAMVVQRLTPLPLEAIVRGYLAGSGWQDYQRSGSICGLKLPPGLALAEPLPQPIYTPSSKAQLGQHDENIYFDQTVALLGAQLAERIRTVSLELYTLARDYALTRGIIIADTKFEFATDAQGQLILIDEVLTPDSSRFWPIDQYQPGINPPSFDKQFVRDYLETLDWNKRPPGPPLPAEIVTKTAAKYQEAQERLIQSN